MPHSTRRHLRAWAALAAAFAASGLPGCGFVPREAVVPMPTQLFTNPCPTQAATRTLLVILPGRGMTLRELRRHGFVDTVFDSKLAVDVLLADAHMGYYKDRAILERLRNDVIAPQQRAGYASIWVAGISLGGMGALIYADAHPEDVQGLFVLAPYLGEPEVSSVVAQSGGLLRWQPPPQPLPTHEIGDQIWRSAQRLLRPGESELPPVYLGYGLSDRFAASAGVLGEALPPKQVFTTAGGHDWASWIRLWPRMLAASPLPRCTLTTGADTS